jgi:hypothetical protein
MLHTQASAASVIPAVLQGAASQTAALQEWRNSAGTVRASLSVDGYMRLSPQTASLTYPLVIDGQSSGINLGAYFGMLVAQNAAATTNCRLGPADLAMPSTGSIGFSSAANNAVSSSSDTRFVRSAAQVIGLLNSTTGGASLEMTEQTAPSAPASNKVRIYAEDNGSGKTRLMALFPSGAAQQIAIEP